jgi:hypothetical protein
MRAKLGKTTMGAIVEGLALYGAKFDTRER